MKGLITGSIAGLLFALALRQLSWLEVPLEVTHLPALLTYLIVVRGFGETLAVRAVTGPLARNLPARDAARTALSVALGFGIGLAADPLLAGFWAERPFRAAVVVLLRPLVAAQWAAAFARGEPTARPLAVAGWRGGLLAILDRETGFATLVEVLLAAELARLAWRELRALPA